MIIKQATPDKILPNPVDISALRIKIVWFYKNNGLNEKWKIVMHIKKLKYRML